MSTDWKAWNFQQMVKCPQFDISRYPESRQKVSLNCEKEPTLMLSTTRSTDDIFSVNFGDKCLERFIDRCCTGDKAVPNVVHYVWYSKKEFGFFDFVSFMSVHRFIKPCLFLVHGDELPIGKYWNYLVNISPNIIHVKREIPQIVFGKKLEFKEHSSDIMRIEAQKSK